MTAGEQFLEAKFYTVEADGRDRGQLAAMIFDAARCLSRLAACTVTVDFEAIEPSITVDGVLVNAETVRKYRGRINALEADIQRIEIQVADTDLTNQKQAARIDTLEQIIRTLGETARKSPAMSLDYFLDKKLPAVSALLNMPAVKEMVDRALKEPCAVAVHSHGSNLYLAKEHLGTLLDVLMLARADAPAAARLVGGLDHELPDKLRRLIDRINTEWRETPAV